MIPHIQYVDISWHTTCNYGIIWYHINDYYYLSVGLKYTCSYPLNRKNFVFVYILYCKEMLQQYSITLP